MPDDLSGLGDEFRHHFDHLGSDHVDGCVFCTEEREAREGVVRLPARAPYSLERRLRLAQSSLRWSRAAAWADAVAAGWMLYASGVLSLWYLPAAIIYVIQVRVAIAQRHRAMARVAELEAKLPPPARALPP